MIKREGVKEVNIIGKRSSVSKEKVGEKEAS